MKKIVLVWVGMSVMGGVMSPVKAQKEKKVQPAKSAFTQTFAFPNKGLVRKSEKDELLRRMNHPDAPKAKKTGEKKVKR